MDGHRPLDLSDLRAELQARGIDVLRVLYSDVLGITRSKDMLVTQMERALGHGPTFCQGVWVTTTHGDVLDAHGSVSDGLPDLVTRIVPSMIRDIPWEPGVAYAVADVYEPDGSSHPTAPRSVLASVIEGYTELGLTPVTGPELEYYVMEDRDGRWERTFDHKGLVYTTGAMVDPHGYFLHTLRMCDKLDIGAFAGNHEFSPSQYEINLWHADAMLSADRTFIFKTAIKDITARQGFLASFMGKPFNDEGGSGFHLHFSVERAGDNIMADDSGGLTSTALAMIAGILEHAPALAALTNPTVNAYKRLGPDTLAPYRINWGLDNRSTMVRIPPERDRGTRLEVRIGDGAANPYVISAAILAAGLDGIRRGLTPPPMLEGWTYEDESADVLPMTLEVALAALATDQVLRDMLGTTFIETFVTLKADEVRRYGESVDDPDTRDVTAWEVEEYLLHY
ncbi:MAG: glutamine synthetase family protein [Candidatus Nanopelagicales bacterium]|nr:glutamine synthetase family protein [Candidatus Nanopelagicales bacterium]MDP5095041.1 glutamine synthetase family protein [Candidatus Nanopelagicales bacterium]